MKTPFSNIIPPLTTEEHAGLEASILSEGCRDALVVWGDILIDGHNRYEICSKHKRPFNTVKVSFNSDSEAKTWIIDNQLGRRNIEPIQKIELARMRTQVWAVKAKEHQREGGIAKGLVNLPKAINVTEEIAKLAGVSTKTATMGLKVLEKATPEEKADILSGDKSISGVYKDIKKAESEEKNAATEKQAVVKPAGKFSTIVIDPPWPMKKIDREVRPNQVDFEYPTMSIEKITEFPIGKHALSDCHLYMWTTQKFLPHAFDIMKSWGFKYVFTMVWHKSGGFQPVGLPQYNCEFVLFGRKGSAPFLDTKDFNCAFNAKRREHSRKPEEFYQLVKRVSPEPRIDIFSREKHDGFSQYGNETGKF